MNTWSCTACGKISNANVIPRAHRRAGAACGPFAAVTVAPDGATVTPATPLERPTTYRQSLLRSFEVCPRRTLHDLRIADDVSVGNVGSTADLGQVVHAVNAEIMRTLRQQGEQQISTQEAVEIMYEVLARGPWVLGATDRDELRGLVLAFASYYRWDTPRIMAIEEPLRLDLRCPDGEVRTLTGQPDMLIALPPDGIEITDYKSGWGVPKSPRQMPAEGDAIVGKEFLSDRGHFQLDCYGLLVLRRYPAAKYARLRELHLRLGQKREATLGRDELEHVEREIATMMMLLDRALTEGDDSPMWKPRPGRHCARQCPVSRSCPIPAEQRGPGALHSPEAADEEAARFVVVDALRQAERDALKTVFEETGRPPNVGDGTGLFWRQKANGKGREFGVFPLSDFNPVPNVPDVEAIAA